MTPLGAAHVARRTAPAAGAARGVVDFGACNGLDIRLVTGTGRTKRDTSVVFPTSIVVSSYGEKSLCTV